MKQEQEKYWVYAIQNETSKRIYIGYTVDLEDRIKRHNSGQVYSTKANRPWELISYQTFESRSQAMWMEGELKKSRGKRLKWIKENKLNEPTPRREGHTGNNSPRQWIG
jgi:putative endonuclease